MAKTKQDKNKTLATVAQSLSVPVDQLAAIQTAVSQIQASLDAPNTVVASLRAKAAQLNEMADLLELVAADEEMDDEEKEEKDEGEGKEKESPKDK